MAKITVKINGQEFEDNVEARLLLVSYIREKARLTGTHIGCDTGHCGACTVLLNGRPIKSCMKLAISVEGAQITTIEGLAEGKLHPLQESFRSNFAIQCGYCTPGMVLSAYALLQNNPEPNEHDIRHALVGNLCMCTGYQQIVDAVSHASEQMTD
ncbi:MAG: (2Fe-2S)-binding protein [Acidobacteriota bacterium]|nr:(2Fe-2S)-binding protein [Acidobacteriota bacterium]